MNGVMVIDNTNGKCYNGVYAQCQQQAYVFFGKTILPAAHQCQ